MNFVGLGWLYIGSQLPALLSLMSLRDDKQNKKNTVLVPLMSDV